MQFMISIFLTIYIPKHLMYVTQCVLKVTLGDKTSIEFSHGKSIKSTFNFLLNSNIQ